MIIKRDDVIKKMNEYIELYGEDEMMVYHSIYWNDWLNTGRIWDNDELTLCRDIMLELGREFCRLYDNEKEEVDLTQILKDGLKHKRLDMEQVFLFNVRDTSRKGNIEKIEQYYYIDGHDIILNYLKNFTGSSRYGEKLNNFFFKDYRLFFIDCLSNNEFMDILYSNQRKEMRNTIKSIDKVLALNYNINKYQHKIRKYFESEEVQEEIDRRLAFQLEGCDNYEKLLVRVLNRKNIYDFGIDKGGKLVTKNNKWFYKICENIIEND